MLRMEKGFTLIEVMVTVVIVAVLASIAMPAYRDYVVRARLPQAHNNLATLRVRLEQFYQDNRTYVGACANNTAAPLPAQDDFTYSCPADTLTANAYVALAAGRAGTPVAGFTFRIDQNNARQTTLTPALVAAGWGAATANCWISKKGGC